MVVGIGKQGKGVSREERAKEEMFEGVMNGKKTLTTSKCRAMQHVGKEPESQRLCFVQPHTSTRKYLWYGFLLNDVDVQQNANRY